MKIAMVAVFIGALLLGCASTSVEMVDGSKVFTSGSCQVEIYQTKDAAEEIGPFREVCVVHGSSAFSFNHSIDGAIKKSLPKLCGCGVEMAYIQSRHRDVDMGLKGLSHVTLVGIKIK